MKRLQHLETGEVFEILDGETGKLKEEGYLIRDDGIVFNRDAIKADSSNNYLKELTKRRH